MMSRITKGIVLMVFGLFCAKAQAAPEAEFWKWFTANEPRLFSFESDQEATFDKLAAAMQRVNPDLTFEFGPIVDGKREFVISAGGIKNAFPAVEALFSSAPALRRWKWTKFRPRRSSIGDIRIGTRTVHASDVHFLLARDDPKVGVVLFFEGYNEQEKNFFGQVGYLFLDEALGEYAVEMQVGFIEFQSRQSKYFQQASPLVELPTRFNEMALCRSVWNLTVISNGHSSQGNGVRRARAGCPASA